MSYNAYVINQSDMHGAMQHVIANGKTERGMIGELRRYVSRQGKHSPYSDSEVVYLWCTDKGVYDVKELRDYRG
jgi:hypothetical protein